MAIRALISRGIDRMLHGRWNTGGYFYSDLHVVSAGASLHERWHDVAKVADFRPEDRVLDVGCAEGLISLEVARQVAHVDAFDADANRIARARQEADKRGIKNVTFENVSLSEHADRDQQYDVILFLNVLNERTPGGLEDLAKLLRKTKRQIIVRANVQKYRETPITLAKILDCMQENDFDHICFSGKRDRGNLIIGSRRGTDARLRVVPPLTLVPTETLRAHPCLQGAEIGSYSDFA